MTTGVISPSRLPFRLRLCTAACADMLSSVSEMRSCRDAASTWSSSTPASIWDSSKRSLTSCPMFSTSVRDVRM